MRKQLPLLALLTLPATSWAQCAILATATPSTPTLASAVTAATAPNPMGVVYNPTRSLYYLVYGGNASYPIEVYNATGTRLTTVSPVGYDSRGTWWNTTTQQLEANTFSNTAIVAKPLDASGYPVASTFTTIFASGNGLSSQNLGAYDNTNNELVYYSAGTLKRVSRATNATISSAAISGLPVAASSISENAVLYTGCPGKEYAVYNPTSKALYFVARATNAYVGTSQLPTTAPANTMFGVAYANQRLFLFDYSARTFLSYQVLTAMLPAVAAQPTATEVSFAPNPARDQVTFTSPLATTLTLRDALGRVVQALSLAAGSQQVHLAGLPAGVYTLTDETTRHTSRLLKAE